MRSYTIDAENEEEFIKEYEKTKSRLSQMTFKNKEIKESIPEDEEDELNFQKKPKLSFHLSENDEDNDSDLGVINNDDDEDLLGADCENDIKQEHSEEKGIGILVNFLKTSVMGELKNMNLTADTLIFNKNKNIMSMSGNAIYDLNIRELVDNILTENDNEYIKSTEGNNNSLKDYILQNIESDSTLKIMAMSNNKSTKNLFMNKFFDSKNNDDLPFEIRKKQIKLFNKNIALQIFDTSDAFHQGSDVLSSIYYKAAAAYFVFIEATNHNVKNYLEYIFEKINKYIGNKTVVIFGVNMLFEEDCTIDGFNLREFSNEKDILFVPININNFDIRNKIINNLLNLILIKGIDHKINSSISSRKGSRDKKFSGFKNKLTNNLNKELNMRKNIYDITKMNIPSSLGYKKRYRIKHINAFDIDDYNTSRKRKLSIDF
jgi:hypothetical protein